MTNQKKQAPDCRARLIKWPWLCGLLGLALVRAALAADSLYQNDTSLSYVIPPQVLPTIDATNFVNNNWFDITFTSTKGSGSVEMLQTEDTMNYTNNGTMVANSSFLTNGSGLILSISPGCGFNFDYYSTTSFNQTNFMAGNFCSPGTVRANSLIDLGNNFLLVSTIGECLVNATNITVPGTIELGENGLIQLTGKDVNLTRGTLNQEGVAQITGVSAAVGSDTNLDWAPSFDLTPTTALSSYPVYLYLNNSTPYFTVSGLGTSNVIVRAIFLQNQLTNNVTAKVFWAPSPFPAYYGGGQFNIEWDGVSVNAATGQTFTNYLYLNVDDAVLGSFNPPLVGGIPANFNFYESNQELFFGAPASSGYTFNFLPSGVAVTNAYSYVNAALIATTTATNNPTTQHNVTNYLSQVMPGRTQISADNGLDLSYAQISGQNYLSLRSPVQFNGSVGAQIFSPYSDINLGVTNGFMIVTNLMEPSVPDWNGTVQAWAARWLYVDPAGVTYDYRVLLVNSSLSPITSSEIQDLRFHATNSLVISDVFNILRSLSIDAQNLTLTTNSPDAASPDGELNLQANGMVWSSSLPNLHNLTNSGAIRVYNLNAVNFGSAASPYGAFINHGLVSDYGAIIYANNFESDGWFSNSVLGSFILQSPTTTLTNGLLYAGGDVSISTGCLVTSNLVLQAARSLTLQVTNLLTDTGVTNGNFWTVGANSIGSGFNLPLLPSNPTNRGDLLGTTVTLFAPANKNVISLWAATNEGVSTAGYTNNVAIGRLILDSRGPAPNAEFTFNGVGVSNALYVDDLELRDSATNRDGGGNVASLNINSNVVIYYAQAVINGVSVAEKLDHKNNGHLRWVPAYAGHFSSTNLVYFGQTNTVNAALAQSPDIDSDGDGIPNASDSTPFFLSSEVNMTMAVTNVPPLSAAISWYTIPFATNCVFYSTNSMGPFNQLLTNFISSVPYPSPPTSVTVFDPVVSPPRYYRVSVSPWQTYPY